MMSVVLPSYLAYFYIYFHWLLLPIFAYNTNASVCLPSSLDAMMISSILLLSLIADISLLGTCGFLPDPGNESPPS